MARSLSARAGSIQMTEGSLYKNILLFSVPLIFSQLLQVMFNMAAPSAQRQRSSRCLQAF